MKRIYRSIIACLLLLFMAFSFSGCSFSFMKNGAEAGNTNPGKPGVGNYEYSDIEPSQVEIKNIPTTDRKELSLVEAVEKVSRSVVAIEMSGGAGAGVIVDIDLPGEEDDNVIYIITCHHVIADQGEICLS